MLVAAGASLHLKKFAKFIRNTLLVDCIFYFKAKKKTPFWWNRTEKLIDYIFKKNKNTGLCWCKEFQNLWREGSAEGNKMCVRKENGERKGSQKNDTVQAWFKTFENISAWEKNC